MRRISIIGTSCAGKSTFARQLAAAHAIPHVELDDIHWNPNWIETPDDILRERVRAEIARDAWVIDGNYQQIRSELWARADTVIWLDYSFFTVFSRALKRTFRRVFFGEPCCNGNRESLRGTFSRDSILLWVLQTYWKRRKDYPPMLEAFRAQGGQVIILRSPKEAREWLERQNSEFRSQRSEVSSDL